MRKGFLLPVILLLCLVAWQLSQQTASQPIKIGVLQLGSNNTSTFAGFKQGLQDAGLHEGEEVLYLYDGPVTDRNKLPAAVKNLLAKQPDLIFTSTTPATRAVKQVTAELAPRLPVVFAPVNDPVSSGVVSNMRQPEANLTGIRLALSEGRRLQSLLDVFPTIQTVCVPYTPDDKAAQASLTQLREAAALLEIELLPVPFARDSSLEQIRALIPQQSRAILLPRESRVMARTKDFAQVAIERQLPLSAARFSQADAGSLMGYGFVGTEIGRQAAQLAKQILAGTQIINLPVETARDYLFFNLDTAARMGQEIPPTALRRAHFLIRNQQKIENL